MGERIAGQAAAGGERDRTVDSQFGEHRLVLVGVDDDRDVRMVLRRGTHHRRPADVDQLDRVARAVLERGRVRTERVEVRHDERDRPDAVLGHVGEVLLVRRVGEQAAVHPRVQGDHPVVEDRRHPGEIGDVGDRHPRLGHRARRTTARHDAPAELVEGDRHVGDPGLVVHGEQCGRHASDRSERAADRRRTRTKCQPDARWYPDDGSPRSQPPGSGTSTIPTGRRAVDDDAGADLVAVRAPGRPRGRG